MSTNRTMAGGSASAGELAKSSEGRTLCRWCSLEVPKGRFTFCSEWCVHEWKLRTNPGYLREQVLKRDKGICALCGFNCVAEWWRLKRLRLERRKPAMAEWGLTGQRKSLWDADHIVPVAEGGGECDLSNLRTLCLRCHQQQTSALRERLKMKSSPASLSQSRQDPE